jgi:hypothetical protein
MFTYELLHMLIYLPVLLCGVCMAMAIYRILFLKINYWFMVT